MKKISVTGTVEVEPIAWSKKLDEAESVVRQEVLSLARSMMDSIMKERRRRIMISVALRRRRR